MLIQFRVAKTGGVVAVKPETQFEFIGGQIGAQIERINDAFKLFGQLFTAITGGVVWLSLETKLDDAARATYAHVSDTLVWIIGAVCIILIAGNVLSWWDIARRKPGCQKTTRCRLTACLRRGYRFPISWKHR